MMPAHPTDLLEAYALHLLSPATAAEIDAHLGACRACQDEIAALATTLGALAYAAPAQAPSAQVEDRLFARIAAARTQDQQPATTTAKSLGTTPSSERFQSGKVVPLRPVTPVVARQTILWRSRRWTTTISAAAVLVAVLIVAVVLARPKATPALTPTKQAIQALHAAHPQIFLLAATKDGPKGAIGAMAMDPTQNRGVVVVAHLPPLPPGKTYEFWLVQSAGADQPTTIMPTGTFTVTSDGSGELAFTTRQPIAALMNAGVSLEHAGGVTTPDSPMLLLIKN